MEKDFEGYDHGTNPVNLMNHKNIKMMKPVEIHHKSDGDLNGRPTFAIVMTSPFNHPVFGEISLDMFNEGLKDIGYKIVKTDQ